MIVGAMSVMENWGREFWREKIPEKLQRELLDPTLVVERGGTCILVTTENNDDLAAYDLTTPTAPTLIDRFDVSEGGTYGGTNFASNGPVRFQTYSADASRFVVVGTEYVATYSFDGTTIAVEDRAVDADPLDVINRGVALALSDTRALVSWFSPYDLNGDDLFPFRGGLNVYSVANDGSLAMLASFPFPSQVRAVLNVPD